MTAAARRAAAIVTVASLVLLVLGMSLIGSRAWAYLGSGDSSAAAGRLHLAVSEETPVHATLTPGDSTQWLVRARLTGAPEGSLATEVAADGELVTPRGLTIEVLICDEKFSATGSPRSVACPGETTVLIPRQPLASVASPAGSDLFALPPLRLGSIQEVLVTMTLPMDATLDVGDNATIGLGFHAAGGDPQPPTDTPERPAPGTPAAPRTPDSEPDFPAGPYAVPQTPGDSAPIPPSDPVDLALTGLDLTALLTLGFGLIGLGTAALLRRSNRDPGRE